MRSGEEPSTVRYGRERDGQRGSGVSGGAPTTMQGRSPSRRRMPTRHTPAGGCARKFMYCITVHISGSVWFAFLSIDHATVDCNTFAGYLANGSLRSITLREIYCSALRCHQPMAAVAACKRDCINRCRRLGCGRTFVQQFAQTSAQLIQRVGLFNEMLLSEFLKILVSGRSQMAGQYHHL